MAESNPANILLEKHICELGLRFKREHRFHAQRKWRFDYVLMPPGESAGVHLCAVEIEGGVYANGRHTRGKGYEADLEKYNIATAMNWHVFRFSTGQILRGEAREFLKIWVAGR